MLNFARAQLDLPPATFGSAGSPVDAYPSHLASSKMTAYYPFLERFVGGGVVDLTGEGSEEEDAALTGGAGAVARKECCMCHSNLSGKSDEGIDMHYSLCLAKIR